MDVRVIGDPSVHYDFSRLGSLTLLLGLTLGCLALQPILLFGISMVEQMFTGSDRPQYFEQILSITAPALSISAMAAPLLVCYKALQFGSSNHGLQWHLFVAFAIAATLGTVYGLRVGIYPIVSSNVCGLTIQLISLAAVYALSETSHRFSKFAFDRIMRYMPSGWKESRLLQTAFHWWLYITICATLIGSLMTAAVIMPLHKVLGPLFTVTCILPYVATFSTFPQDILSYRRWERLPYNSPEKAEGPKGVDITTLVIMQINNVLWNWYGLLIKDPAVVVSSIFSILAACVQLIVFLFPVTDLNIGMRLVRLDPAYPFLGRAAFLTKGALVDGSLRMNEVTEKLSAVELMPTTSGDAVCHVSEPPYDGLVHPYETPLKFARSEGLVNHQAINEVSWSLYTTSHPVAPHNPDI